jgi:hypothetical protein
MRPNRLLLAVAAAGTLLVPAAADGAARLSLKVADKEAKKAAAVVAKTYADEEGTRIQQFTLDRCERDGRRRADCEVTYLFVDGSECDDTIHVRIATRGKKVSVTHDSGPANDRVFEDCTMPEDDSLVEDEDGEGQPDAEIEDLPADALAELDAEDLR